MENLLSWELLFPCNKVLFVIQNFQDFFLCFYFSEVWLWRGCWYLWVSLILYLVTLKLRISVFWPIGRIFSHYFFKYSFSSISFNFFLDSKCYSFIYLFLLLLWLHWFLWFWSFSVVVFKPMFSLFWLDIFIVIFSSSPSVSSVPSILLWAYSLSYLFQLLYSSVL